MRSRTRVVFFLATFFSLLFVVVVVVVVVVFRIARAPTESADGVPTGRHIARARGLWRPAWAEKHRRSACHND